MYLYNCEVMRLNTDHYRIIIAYTLLFSALVLFSGLWLFALREPWSSVAITKSLQSALEQIVPHLFAMSILAFILTHFLLFINTVKPMQITRTASLIFGAILVENTTHYLTSLKHSYAIWINITSLLLLSLLMCTIILKIALDLNNSNQDAL